MEWSEESSRLFIDYGRYFVPERDVQIETICALIPARTEPFHVLELCCGEGLLAEAILQQHTASIVHAYDGSAEMLAAAQARLEAYGERFDAHLFDLIATGWRQPPWPLHAVVSSLALHHLDGMQKQLLFKDTYRMLSPGGVFIIADLIQPAGVPGLQVAAEAWDRAVSRQALALDGNTDAFNYFEQEQWNYYRYPDPIDRPSRLLEQLKWLEQAGFIEVDVYWMQAGHAIWGGRRIDTPG